MALSTKDAGARVEEPTAGGYHSHSFVSALRTDPKHLSRAVLAHGMLLAHAGRKKSVRLLGAMEVSCYMGGVALYGSQCDCLARWG